VSIYSVEAICSQFWFHSFDVGEFTDGCSQCLSIVRNAVKVFKSDRATPAAWLVGATFQYQQNVPSCLPLFGKTLKIKVLKTPN